MSQAYTLTKQQEGLWIEWKLHPHNSSYNTCVKVKLIGSLDVTRLQESIQTVTNYFDAFRTYFVEKDGVPYHTINDIVTYTVPFEDISSGEKTETPEHEKQANDRLTKALCEPIDLTQFPIIKGLILKSAHETYYFVGIIPHIVADGMSANLFLQAVSVMYNEGLSGLDEKYKKTRKEWGDYKTYLENQDPESLKQSKAYWETLLDGAPHVVDFGKPSIRNDKKEGRRTYFDLSPDISQALKKLAYKHRTTHFAVISALFSIMIHYYFRKNDMLIGYPVNIRPKGFKHLFGFFVNIIPQRIKVNPNNTLEEHLVSIGKTRKETKPYQDFHAMDIVRLFRDKDPNFDGRVFNLSMAQTVSRFQSLQLNGIHSIPMDTQYHEVNDDLALSYEVLEDRFGLWLEYRTGVIDHDLANQFIEHMISLASKLVQTPDLPIRQLSLLSEDDITTLTTTWNDTDKQRFTNDKPIHQLFSEQVRKTPNAPALLMNNEVMSYHELDEQSNQVAHVLHNHGVRRHSTVTLQIDRSFSQIAYLIGILKCGATYVPLPKCYPESLVKHIQNDVQSSFHIDSELDLNDSPKSSLRIESSPSDLAYIIFTSGSTGKPKGVMIEHRNALNTLLWMQSEFKITDQDSYLQNTPYSFDVSVHEIFWPLLSGGKVVLVPPGENRNPDTLIRLINTHKITLAGFVPSMMDAFISRVADNECPSIRAMIAAGETLSNDTKNAFYDTFPNATLYNLYGITEVSIHTTIYKCKRDEDVTIGVPFDNTQLYIVDDQLNLVPPGTIGEILVGGDGVARGYINNTELTAEKFIPNPFLKGSRCYKSGDLGLIDRQGTVHYKGRRDRQVKIRGFRIECSQIETVMNEHPDVESSVVIPLPQSTTQLAAYYVSSKDLGAELKKDLSSKLPDYMVPSFFTSLDHIPLTQNDKLDIAKLPLPSQNQTAIFEQPQTESQIVLRQVWANVLRINEEKISIHDSFFELGGDSLMIIQCACELEKVDYTVTIQELFDKKTISDIAPLLRKTEPSHIPQEKRSGELPSPFPRHLKFFSDPFSHPHHWNRSFTLLHDQDIQPEITKRCFETLLEYHDGLRLCFISEKAIIEDSLETPFHVLHENETLVDEINLIQGSFSLEKSPLAALIHVKRAEGKTALIFIIHHLLIDMVSSRILLEDFITTYHAVVRDLTPTLPKKSTHPIDIAAYYKNLSVSEELFQHYAEFDTHFESLKLKRGKEKHAKTEHYRINETQFTAVKQQLVAETEIPLQDYLLSKLASSISRWKNLETVSINTCGHGRQLEENISRTVGWLNTVYPVQLSGKESIQEHHATLKKLASTDVDYMASRYIHNDMRLPNNKPEIFFNFVNNVDIMIPDELEFDISMPSSEWILTHPENHLEYLLYIEIALYQSEMIIHCTYSEEHFKLAEIQTLFKLVDQSIERDFHDADINTSVTRDFQKT